MMSNIQIIKNSITDLAIDAIVNAANSGLRAGSGVCGEIFAEAGHRQLQKACDEIGHCEGWQIILFARNVRITPLKKYISGGNKAMKSLPKTVKGCGHISTND